MLQKKRIEFFVSSVLDYFIRFKNEKSVNEINKNPKFLSHFRHRCIDEVKSYKDFDGTDEGYREFLEKKDDMLSYDSIDSIENIEIDFQKMLKDWDIAVNKVSDITSKIA